MTERSEPAFFDRRRASGKDVGPGQERRQFSNSHEDLTPDARELGLAVDRYKLTHRRRFITYEELLHVVQSLGYSKTQASTAGVTSNNSEPSTVGA